MVAAKWESVPDHAFYQDKSEKKSIWNILDF